MTEELERLGSRVVHPLTELFVKAPTPVRVPRTSTEQQPKPRERKPPPGWLNEKEAFNNAMAVIGFATKGKGRVSR